ncbi:hypothetical protein GS458_0353 [Geobacillus stearothermophilus]|nr:hypothetical protein GS458_0353 [Geobacillus stearothermophilus]
MGISLFIILLFVISLILLMYGFLRKIKEIKWISFLLLLLSIGLGIFVFNLIGYM